MERVAESLLFSDKTRNKKIADSGKTIRYFWSRRRDSNPRPLRPERNALPAALRLDFFSFLSVFVSGQTCGQATYFEFLGCSGLLNAKYPFLLRILTRFHNSITQFSHSFHKTVFCC